MNELPVARFVYDANNLTVVFNASASSDPDGEIVNYFWTFGDDAGGEGKVVTHVYPENGTYETELTVTDDKGGKNKTSKKVIVEKIVGPAASNPVAVIDIVDIEDLKVTLSGSDSYDPDGGSITTYAWSFSDGATATGEEVEHEFVESGTYTVTLTVTDDEGATGSTSIEITVPPKPPPPTPHPEGPPGLLHAIEVHIEKLAETPDNHGLQNSLNHLQMNLQKWLDKHGGQEEGKSLGNVHGNGDDQAGT
ncbi:MAG: PKD domain-containing protein [Thermoplasmata archaeon]